MVLTVYTTKPQELLDAIKKGIDRKHIDTWTCDTDGDFTHSPPQWANKAWLRPTIVSGCLQFGEVAPQGKTVDKATRGVFHGRLVEMLITHFSADFTSVSVRA